ncbi:uncharacterized protein LOC125178622 [Hyalella azteca]|uniref:Uncharacterized protein LOC125178622 n=1 Tax=Hyalella azteca TaxID=294128 RepID=A0A979FNZ2_HYAAZ|nr:uncharacterized protein LOC125178622 [Hyalella azteca]
MNRAAIAISLLAEVDLLCEQHDDCRVKLDTLLQLLSSRQPSAVQALDFSPEAAGVLTPKTTNKPCQDAVPLACGFTMKKISRKHGSRGEKENSFVDALSDSVSNMRIEAMRQAGPRDDVASPCVDSSNDDFVISDAQNKIGSHWLAIKSRLKFLSQASTKLGRYKLDTEKSTCPGSPSLEHRETALKLPLWSSPANNNSEHEANREEEDVSSNSLLQAYFPGLCEVYLSVGAMLASLHRLGSRWQAAQDTIDTVCRAHDVMQQTAQQQCRHIYDVLGSAGYTPADAQRCGVYATNTLLVGWCSVQQSAVQLLVARDRWTEASQLCNSAIESATALPVESVQRHHCHLLPLLQQARHLVNACNYLANRTRGGSPSLRIPLGSPVPCPTVGVITPRQSPTRSSDPPPLHRGPLNYPRSPRRRHMSSDSDEDTVSLSNLSNETAPLQLKNKLNNLSHADDEPKVRGRSYRKNDIKAYGSRAEKSFDASKGSQASVGKRKLIPPKIIVIPESLETNPSVASCEKDKEMEDCKFNLLSAKQKIYNLCFSDKSSDKSDGVSSEEASLLPLNDANVKKSSLRLLRANAGSAANCPTTKTNEMKKNKLTTKKIPDSNSCVQPRRTRAKNKDGSDVENISEKKVVAKRAPRSTAETTRDERSEAATARRTRTAMRQVVS